MGPLSGYKMIEIVGIGPCPFAAMMLADMGAEVLRVDRAQAVRGGDPAQPPPEPLNRGRRSVALDLKSEQGRELFLRLVPHFDVVAENFRPGVMERLGLGYDAIADAHPRAIYVSISGFGERGPSVQRRVYDSVMPAYSGIAGHQANPETGVPSSSTTSSATRAPP